jgi:hypothetical protein
MKFDIKFDPDLSEFQRGLERQVKDVANNAIAKFGRGLQAACDEVYASREGMTPDQIFAELRANIDRRSLPVTLDDSEVRQYAETIADGTRINVKLPPAI